eukprot:1188334-Rhodomonas_salina.1
MLLTAAAAVFLASCSRRRVCTGTKHRQRQTPSSSSSHEHDTSALIRGRKTRAAKHTGKWLSTHTHTQTHTRKREREERVRGQRREDTGERDDRGPRREERGGFCQLRFHPGRPLSVRLRPVHPFPPRDLRCVQPSVLPLSLVQALLHPLHLPCLPPAWLQHAVPGCNMQCKH